jgi:hypothetical protein
MLALVDRVIAAHGGMAPWSKVEAVVLRLAIAGVVWQLKGHATRFERVSATVMTASQRVLLSFDAPGYETSDWMPVGLARGQRRNTATTQAARPFRGPVRRLSLG